MGASCENYIPSRQHQQASIRRPNFYCSASLGNETHASITPDPQRKLNLTLQLIKRMRDEKLIPSFLNYDEKPVDLCAVYRRVREGLWEHLVYLHSQLFRERERAL